MTASAMSDTSDCAAFEAHTASGQTELRTSRLADGTWLIAGHSTETGSAAFPAADRSDGLDEGV
jgi:hypothetical protein